MLSRLVFKYFVEGKVGFFMVWCGVWIDDLGFVFSVVLGKFGVV